MIAPNVIVASAAVTLKLAVAVVPPCITCLTNECSTVWSTHRSTSASTSKMGMRPIAFAQRMKRKNVRSSGVHVFTHLRPTFGRTMESRMNSTTYSRRVIEAAVRHVLDDDLAGIELLGGLMSRFRGMFLHVFLNRHGHQL